jgi:(p)ppGpp synthase/HD superfamily hydrolase
MIDFTEAFKIAAEVHGNQRDKSGEPYMGHVCRVMSQMETDEERLVAILHDAFEDSVDRPDLNRSVHARVKLFYRYVIYDAVLDLTHIEDDSYEEYIIWVMRNPLAVKVKLADIRDNMDPARLAKLSPGTRDRLIGKYGRALTVLLQ